jgi:membrane-associated phospholipid phosphatase
VALALVGAFLLLGILVATGATQPWDEHLVHRLRPGDAWNATQVSYAPWMSRLEPRRMYAVLGVASVVSVAWRRTWWPLLLGGLLLATSVTVTLAAKFSLGRVDPHGQLSATGGSYPSGHVIALLVGLGGCLLVLFPRVRWWLWAPVAWAAGLLSVALLVCAAHWPTDVLGGVLLALGLLAAASLFPPRRRAERGAGHRAADRTPVEGRVGNQSSAWPRGTPDG